MAGFFLLVKLIKAIISYILKHMKEQSRFRLQSAMEYLMTYGWAIIIIALVIVVFYALGFLNANTYATQSCTLQAGFGCIGSVLSDSGVLVLNLEQGTQDPINVTGVSCNEQQDATSLQAPINPPSNQVEVLAGANATIYLECYNQNSLFSGPIGTPFRGYLTIYYKDNVNGFTGVIKGQLSTVVSSTIGLPASGNQLSATYYVPITITNSQSIGTPSPFQQKLTIDSAAYGNYINSGWSNVEFSTDVPGTLGNTYLNAWVESGASNTAANTVVWVNLPNGIGAGNSITIYMDFATNNVLSIAGPTGEAPTLSAFYGQYDDGAQVFNYYTNFKGTSLPANWEAVPSTAVVINDGMTVENYPNTYNWDMAIYVDSYNPATEIVDFYGDISASGTLNQQFIGPTRYIPPSTSVFQTISQASGSYSLYNLDPSGASNVNLGISSFGTPELFSVWAGATGSMAMVNYGSQISNTNDFTVEPTEYLDFYNIENGPTTFVQWLRIRAMPPNGFMPSFSLSALSKTG